MSFALAGEPDFDTPDFLREAARKSINEGFTHYSPASGYEDLRKAVGEKLRRENGIACNYETDIVITPGSSAGIFLAMLSLLDPGDEVLVPDPAWFHYKTLIRLCGAEPVSMPVKFEGDTSSLDLEGTRRHVTNKTKILILNSPSNPTGMMLSRDVLKEIGEFAEKHDLWIISDEVYEKITYSGNLHISPVSPGTRKPHPHKQRLLQSLRNDGVESRLPCWCTGDYGEGRRIERVYAAWRKLRITTCRIGWSNGSKN